MKSRDEMIAMIRECIAMSHDTQDRLKELDRCIKLNSRIIRKESLAGYALMLIASFPLFFRRSPGLITNIRIPVWLLVLGYYGLVAFACWLYILWGRRRSRASAQIHRHCTECGYDLHGLHSVLGDEYWVGPERCPECGLEFPAVG